MDTNFVSKEQYSIVKEMDKLCDEADKPCTCGDKMECPACRASITYNEILCEILRRGKPGSYLMRRQP